MIASVIGSWTTTHWTRGIRTRGTPCPSCCSGRQGFGTVTTEFRLSDTRFACSCVVVGGVVRKVGNGDHFLTPNTAALLALAFWTVPNRIFLGVESPFAYLRAWFSTSARARRVCTGFAPRTWSLTCLQWLATVCAGLGRPRLVGDTSALACLGILDKVSGTGSQTFDTKPALSVLSCLS